MNYKEFFEKSKKIELYPFSAQTKLLGNYNLIPSPVNNGNPVQGLYFPNDTEIKNLWDILATEEQKSDLELTGRIYNINSLAEGLFNTINAPIIASKIINFLQISVGNLHKSSAGKNSTYASKGELIEILGKIYTQSGLLENDIRMRVIEESSKFTHKPNIIVDFKPAVVGYIGVPMILEYKSKE